MKFNWEDFNLRVADLIEQGLPRQDAELQVQYEMEEEQEELVLWMEQPEEEFDPFMTINS